METQGNSYVPVAEFYKGKTIFVTGATGFIGKVLVEKLLRSCPEIKKIYILLREKRGKSVQLRMQQFISNQIFDILKRENPEALKKVVAVQGDVTLKGLGLREMDQNLLAEEVSVVFHSAASVRFDDPLKVAIRKNTTATQEVVLLCKQMPKLEVLLYVSTAYSNSHHPVVDEVIYPALVDPQGVIDCVEWMNDDVLEAITPKLMDNLPNTYAFSKSLAEHVVYQQKGRINAAILRPSIVNPSVNEPVPGWVDVYSGLTGMLIGAGKGVMRTMYCKQDLHVDLVPVDYVVNSIIVAAWHTGVAKPNDIFVYNCVAGEDKPAKWGEMINTTKQVVKDVPLNDSFWYPGGSLKSSKLVNFICFLLVQLFPALIVDFFLLMTGKKPFLVKLQIKLYRTAQALEYYVIHEWKFLSKNHRSLLNRLSPEDKEIYYYDISTLNWTKYFRNCALGARQYLLKEDISTLPAARAHFWRMYYVDMAAKVILFLLITWCLFAFIQTQADVFQITGNAVESPLKSIFVGAQSIEQASTT